ncbi:MAG: sugar ABC transporter ATP-binding protein, partial [Propionibacteriaceae bacterium]|nr:sugar ABC transporter ATP-binding protein [Propionibacteriaceae bacterium]
MADAANAAPEPGGFVELRGIYKSFGGVHALSGVDFVIPPACVVGLVGENGAGKSTLLKVLSGTYTADVGKIVVDGQSFFNYGPAEARRAGISMVTQELSLFPHMSVAENISIGREPVMGPGGSFGLVSSAQMRLRAQRALDQLKSSISPDAMVRDLPFADRQNVEIAKALVDDPRVLVLDEPTSGLREWEVDRLFDTIRSFRADGRSVVFISHRMSELFAICDRFTVLKDGQSMGDRLVNQTNSDELVSLMVGRKLESLYPTKAPFVDRSDNNVELSLNDFHVGGAVGPIDLTLYRGEILGVAGLAGNGQNELLEGLAGLRRATGTIGGRAVGTSARRPFSSPGSAVRAGFSLVPEDRKNQGLILPFEVFKNVTLSGLRQVSSFGFISQRRESAVTREYIDSLRIRTPSQSAISAGLSGGNQQKVVLAKALSTRPKVLLLSDPTRGIDVGTKQELYMLVRDLADQGVATLF